MKLIFIILFLLAFVSCKPQEDKYVITKFKEGLPSEIQFKWNKSIYASINSGNFFKGLYLVSKDSLETPDNCLLFVIDSSGFSYTNLDFIKSEENIYSAAVSLNTTQEDKLDTLRLILNLQRKTLTYHWDNKIVSPTVIKEYKLKVGSILPKIEVTTLNGNWTNDGRNKIIVINWWATSCLPCIEEIPVLNKLVDKHQDENIEFVAIVWDKSNYSDFIAKHPFNYLQGFSSKELTDLFGDIFPRHIVVGKDGKILLNKLGGSKQIGDEIDSIISSKF
jgi:thiol-disulfide isomerase/thioredoxin